MRLYSQLPISSCRDFKRSARSAPHKCFARGTYPEDGVRRNSPTKLSLTLFLAIWAVIASSSAQARKLIDKTVMTVNDDIILESDIDKFQKKIKSKSFQELFGGIDPKVLHDRDAVLQLLVEEKIVNQQVKKLELTASDQEIDGQIRTILKRNNINLSQLSEQLKRLNTNMAEYREGIKRQIERRNLVEREIKPSQEVSEEQLRHFYERNAGKQDEELQYKIAHILIEPKTKAGTDAADRAKKIYDELSGNPEKFDAFVKDYSDDNGTSSSGGVLGFYSQSQLSKEFRDAVTKTAPGKITSPIKTKAGYHIIKVLETRAGGEFASLPKERKDALKMQMMSEDLEKRMAMWLERRKREAYIKKAATLAKTPAPKEKTDEN